MDELAILQLIVSKNVQRRHMNAGQRAFAADALEPMFKEAAKQRQREHAGTSPGNGKNTFVSSDKSETEPIHARKEAAKAVGASDGSTANLKYVKKNAPDLERFPLGSVVGVTS